MSNSVEDQIVNMQFNNKQFETGVATSLSTLDRLKSALSFKGTGQGLSDINRAAAGVNLNPIAAGIQGINKAWLGMTTIAVTALSNVTNRAVDAGLRMGKSLTIDPIAAGFSNYETKINAVQTILANTADAGTNLKDVTGQLNVLNEYANKTVYNFSEMAKNIGTFTAAGVDLKTSTESIKGIANLAALSGSTSEQASSAMYQLSQAIAAGQVHLQDWNSVVNAGIGGAAFQKNLIQTAIATGQLDANQVKLGKTMADTTVNGVAFRQSLTPPPGGTSWLTSKVLTTSLSTFTGDLTKAQLVAKGFKPAVADAILSQAKMAKDAATKIKTFTQMFQALKEEVASAWSKVFEALFGNINQAKAFLTPLHNMLNNAFTKPIYDIAKALKSWRKAGGFDDLIAIFKNLGTIVGNLLYPFKEIFSVILPSSKHAGKGLEGFTKTLANITGWVAKATSVTHRFGFVFYTIGRLFKQVVQAGSPLLGVFKQLGPLVDKGIQGIDNLAFRLQMIWPDVVRGLMGGMDPSAMKKSVTEFAGNIITWIKNTLGIHSPAATMVPIGVNIVQGIVVGIENGAQYLIKGLQKVFVGMGKAFKWLVQNINYSDVLKTINTGLFLGLILIFRNFTKAFGGTLNSFREMMDKAGGVLDQMTSNLKAMQQKVKSEVIRNIAISVGILAASALLLSTIDGKKLGFALGAIGGLMVSLIGAMKVLTGGKGTDNMDAKAIAKKSGMILAISTAMIAFSTAILILTGAVALMGQLDPDTIKKGLEGVAGIITLIVGATAILSKTGGGATIMATATAMLIMSAALTAFVGVMKLYEKLNWKTLIRGGGAAAAVIVAIGLAMRSFGKGSFAGSAGLLIASAALVVLSKALQQLAKIGVGDMIKSVLAISAVLGDLAVASEAMNPESASSLFIMAAALVVLAKALQIIGGMSLWSIIKALLAITAAILIMAGTAAALSELSPLIAALGTALLLVGGAIFLAGAGILAFAVAMGILAVVGPAAFQAVADGIQQLLDVLPKIGEALGQMAVSFFTGIVEAAGPLTKALGKLGSIIIGVLSDLTPKVGHLAGKMFRTILRVIVNNQVAAAHAMVKFVVGMLQAAKDGVPKMVKAGTNLIISIIQGLSKNGVKIANATGKAILSFLNGLDKAIKKYEPKIIAAGGKIAADLVSGAVQGIKDGAGAIGDAAHNLAQQALDKIKNAWKIFSPSHATREFGNYFGEGARLGIKDKHEAVSQEAEAMANKALDVMKMTFSKSRRTAHGLEDLRPKITPVLDLSQIERDAMQISGKMGSPKIAANVTRNKARDIASEHAARHNAAAHDSAGDTYNFTQVINSPKPVNHVKAYRGLKSQIALFKEVTGK